MASTITGAKVIVVGGGLAGLSAAHTVLERGGRCLVLDKKDFLGGNSVKATSGINGALTNTQIKLGIPDSAALFERDTALSANKGASADSTPLIHTLTYESAPAVEWLIDSFGLDLSLISRLGGHSQPRTHRGKERFPGMTITYALMEKFEHLASQDPTRAQVIVNAAVQRLLTDDKGAVIGVEYEYKGKRYTEHGPVVIATGGFGADFSDNSILKQVRPDLMHLPTTNGDHCTGDGIKMSTAIGGATIDLPAVQVHPTGLVNPKEPDTKIKFLAAEALRGVGGLLLDANGKRFCNELGTRDYVTGEMWKNKGPFRLVLNSKGVKEIEWHCKHYVGRGLMRHFRSGAELAKEIGVSPDVIAKTFQTYNAHEKAGDCPYGKKYFQNMPFDTNDEFHVAIVTPVVHYCMGGVQIDEHAQILRDAGAAGSNGKATPIPGLFAAGEVCGGVHGKNRLGGSGLLGAVVYGRVAGATSSKYLLNQLSSQTAHRRAGQVLGQLFNSITIQPVSDGLLIKLGTGDSVSNASAASTAAAGADAPSAPAAAAATASPAAPTTAAASKLRNDITMEEVAKHNTDKDCWVVVNGTVLDATTFLDKHPGGRQSILLFAGKDASEEFNMLHKPDVVTKYAPEIILGTLKK